MATIGSHVMQWRIYAHCSCTIRECGLVVSGEPADCWHFDLQLKLIDCLIRCYACTMLCLLSQGPGSLPTIRVPCCPQSRIKRNPFTPKQQPQTTNRPAAVALLLWGAILRVHGHRPEVCPVISFCARSTFGCGFVDSLHAIACMKSVITHCMYTAHLLWLCHCRMQFKGGSIAEGRVSQLTFMLATYALNGTYLGMTHWQKQFQICGADKWESGQWQR